MIAASVVGVIYGTLVVVGGVVGYLTAGSLASALAGAICGVAMWVCGWAMWNGKRAGWYAGLTLATVLAVFFGARFWQGGAFMPTGLMAVLSGLTVVLLLLTPVAEKRRALA
jgi:uncharacterized membrane protein (UPF0136 family)